ncbi:MAG: hypothetical protein M1829_004369 [Trizodia sp. TS-e1964]|nr:MAG: hypothetical protein M1829_004369 [Trizodia sp. TS-e1964]
MVERNIAIAIIIIVLFLVLIIVGFLIYGAVNGFEHIFGRRRAIDEESITDSQDP